MGGLQSGQKQPPPRRFCQALKTMNKRPDDDKKIIRILTALAAAILVAGCAAPRPTGPEVRNDVRPPIRNREANAVLPMFVGHYEVTDSRRNRRQVTVADLSIDNGVATLKLYTKDGLLITTLQANECSGDVVNKHTQHMYLACFGPDLYGVIRHSFSFSKVPVGYIHKSGAMIPLYDPMPVTDGYLIDFLPGEGRTIAYPLAARRVAP